MPHDRERFTVTEQHLKLLRQFNVDWNDDEFGAPTIDPKRPYGNGDVHRDIGKILGILPDDVSDPDDLRYSVDKQIYLERLHRQTKTVLQIVLASGMFAPGEYESDRFKDNWRPVVTAEFAEPT